MTPERLRELLHYDPRTGTFTRLTQQGRFPPGSPVGNVTRGYLFIKLDYRLYRAHRLAWLYMHGEWPPLDIDHRDGDGTNNRKRNLRLATRAQNMQNLHRARCDSATGVLGVSLSRGKFLAQGVVNGKSHWLGRHDTLKAAIAARKAFEENHHHAFD